MEEKSIRVKRGTVLVSKLCTQCKTIALHTSKGKHCIFCVKKRSDKALQKNKEKNQLYSREWREQNKESLKISKKKYYEATKESEQALTYRTSYYRKNKDRIKVQNTKSRLKNLYNITNEIFEEILELQNNCCKICNNPFTKTGNSKLCIDHCHTKGNVRGLLCNNCNAGLGMFKDSETNLQNAIEYLKKSKL